MKRNKESLIVGVILGSIAGGVLAQILTPVSGRRVRREIKRGMKTYINKAKSQSQRIIDDTKTVTSSWIDRAQDVFTQAKKYASGRIDVPRDTIENEITKLRNALAAAVEAYKSYEKETEETAPPRGETRPSSVEVKDQLTAEYEDETLPKRESMGRRMDNER
ncbi:MAG: YtxH domain-containing protein [Ignavibacteria bacterium]|jgi:gas vesicle protein|nr:YtxH domain-containing protein [Ignavibacteria bacterium]MCU7501499.1 YtxH domain-containing protein [Ignavibacteria bacterium]MCU7515985.1 YtxH domain-containing protein [Ignavibacteria bacterium]